MTQRKPAQPTDRTSRRWFAHGYQEALADVQVAYDRGGEAGALQWIKDNRVNWSQS